MTTPLFENLLGALGLLIVDEVDDALAAASGIGSSSQAALLGIDTYASCTIDQLRTALGLSHAAAVRCVAALVEAGWVHKGQGGDKRSVALELTAEGRRLQRQLQAARAKALRRLGDALTAPERQQFEALARKLLRHATRDESHGMRLCRLCDCGPCLGANCPVEGKLQGWAE